MLETKGLMKNSGQEWFTRGDRTVYATVYRSKVSDTVSFSDFEGAYEVVEGGFKCQHRNKKIWATETQARLDVLAKAISNHQKQIDLLKSELRRIVTLEAIKLRDAEIRESALREAADLAETFINTWSYPKAASLKKQIL
jgi:hypothetical protein